MARVTVEDCLANVKNRFELVMVSAKRARALMNGTVDPTVDWDNDKSTVVALREIAKGTVTAKILDEDYTPKPAAVARSAFDVVEAEKSSISQFESSIDDLLVVTDEETPRL